MPKLIPLRDPRLRAGLRSRILGPVAVVVAASLAFATATLPITPSSHDFGKAVVQAVVEKAFQVSIPASVSEKGPFFASIEGSDPGHFDVREAGPPAGLVCYDIKAGVCEVLVYFKPIAVGAYSATLVVGDSLGNRGTAALRGEGVASLGCRPELVTCNYAHLYSGEFTIKKVDSTIVGLDTKLLDTTTLDVTIDQGVATCDGVQRGFNESYYGDKLLSRTSFQGRISGPGLFALEFVRSDGQRVYRMSFACPSSRTTITTDDYVMGTTTTETTTPEPAVWRHAELVADYQPATGVAMDSLTGTQMDLREPMGDDVGGYVLSVWSLKRE